MAWRGTLGLVKPFPGGGGVMYPIKKFLPTTSNVCGTIQNEPKGYDMIPLFDSESFAFIGSADGELIVNCRRCRGEAEVQIDTTKIALVVACRACDMKGEFKFRPSVHFAPAYQIANA